MLRPEERDQRDIEVGKEPIGSVSEAGVNRRWIRNEANPPAGNQRAIAGQ